MNKRLLSGGLIVLVLIAVLAGVTQNASAATIATDSLQAVNAIGGKGYGKAGAGAGAGVGGTGAYAQLPAPGDLSQEEADALVYMVEEEKLARDVYNVLYATWGSTTFQTIATSEQAHMDAIKNLLAVYGLTDPSSSQAGVFSNPDLQVLYDQLTARGSQSLAEAFKVGGAIEEIDILDLQVRLAQTDNADIQQVFNNLLKGSSNHLRAFVNALQMQTGEVYQPQYMSAEAYQAIVSTTTGGYGNTGGGQGGNGGGGGQGGGGWRGGRP
jgi:hypothetical protein